MMTSDCGQLARRSHAETGPACHCAERPVAARCGQDGRTPRTSGNLPGGTMRRRVPPATAPKRPSPSGAARTAALLVILLLAAQVAASQYVVKVQGDQILLNNQPVKILGLRCSNALISEAKTTELIDNLNTFKSYGVNTVSAFLMGSRFGDIKGYRPDASLDPTYAARLGRIIEAADARGMIVLVGCLYWSTSTANDDLGGWKQADANKAIANTIQWLKDRNYRNVFVDVDNEGMAHDATGWNIAQMIDAAHAVDPSIMIAYNDSAAAPANADLYIHHSPKVSGKPWLDSESTPTNAPGGYWGSYSKETTSATGGDYYNYSRIGRYTTDMKNNQFSQTRDDHDNYNGHMLASTWLQCAPNEGVNGPFMTPGGRSNIADVNANIDTLHNDAGILWWLEYIKDRYGAWTPPPPLNTPQTGIWGRFEASVTNTKTYADPFRNVTLNVTWTRPDGSKVNFWGFYDGGSTWKLRFMPDQTGTWSYVATFSDGSPGTSGTFACVASSAPGLISKDETNPMWFGYKGGGHVLVRSFHCGDRFFATNWDDPANAGDGEKRTAFLDWVQSQGYNMLCIASHYLNREVSGRGLGWDTPDLWDGAARKLKAAEYQKLELMLNDLAARKMLVHPFAGFFGQSSDFPTDHADQELYLRYTLARVGCYWNLLFNIAGPEPLLVPAKFQNAMTAADIDRLGALIQNLDVFGHLDSVHNKTGDDAFKNKAYTGYGTLQGPKTTSTDTLSSGLLENHHASKPLYAQETLWPGNQNHPAYTDTQIRKNAWTIQMAATALNYADMDGDSSSGFSGSLDLADKVQSRHDIVKKIWDFMATVSWYRLSPRQDLVSRGYCLAEPGKEYLVYLPSKGGVNVTVPAGTYTITWINAQNTPDKRSGGETTSGTGLNTPTDGDDWLLHLELGNGTPVNQPPVVQFITPTNGVTQPEGVSLYVNVAATDPDGSVANVKLYLNGTYLRQENNPPYEWNAPTQNDPLLVNMAEGTYALRAVATDNQGATGEATITVTVGSTPDNQPPTVTFLTPTDGASLTEGVSLYIQVDASDADGNVANVKLYLNGTYLRQENNPPYEWNAPTQNDPLLKNMVAGTYALWAVATDNEGAEGEATITVTVGSAPPVNEAPTIDSFPWADPNPVILPNATILSVMAGDDGLPDPPGDLIFTWSRVSGPGTVTFDAKNGTPLGYSCPATFSAAGEYVIRVTVSDGELSGSETVSVSVQSAGVAYAIPGRIEAEAYRAGGEGVGYHDTTSGNSGGAYRTDDVDIQATGDTDGAFNVGWVVAGEWLTYDVDVQSAGSYTITCRVATANTTDKTLHLEVDGANVTGPMTYNTGGAGWQSYQDVSIVGVPLTAGPHVLKVVFDSSSQNLNYIRIDREQSANQPPTVLTFTPVDDAYLEDGTRYDTGELRVENASRNRTSYLKFAVSGLTGAVTKATLKLKNIDTQSRSGTYKIALGSHSNWTEGNLTTTNAPAVGALLATHSGSVAVGAVISFDVTSGITGDGTRTLVLHMDASAGNDLKFSSAEGAVSPELVVECQ